MAGIRVSKFDLAHIFGVDAVMIDVWLKQGMPYVSKPGNNTGALSKQRDWVFDTAEVIEWRMSVVSEDAALA